ncbi:MAG: HAD family hydrolase [Tannerellaceae bacterium]|jgi:putative hydrolase of the HAD superfamily|nr:HAD family hydrolase [Tannerellaceae bacterium]
MANKMIEGIKVIGFDADDTLWVNETYFLETEHKFCELLSPYVDKEKASAELYRTEMQNMHLYGYGVKAFILSVIETAIHITSGKVPGKILGQLLEVGKKQLTRPTELLDSVEETLNALVGRYRLILVTKGDLLDQEQKLRRSGLEHLFHHVEIMSDKTEREYKQLLKHIDIRPEEFLMIGNSVRSDILPPLALGCHAIHVPFHITWEHEKVCEPLNHDCAYTVDSLWDIISLLP